MVAAFRRRPSPIFNRNGELIMASLPDGWTLVRFGQAEHFCADCAVKLP